MLVQAIRPVQRWMQPSKGLIAGGRCLEQCLFTRFSGDLPSPMEEELGP